MTALLTRQAVSVFFPTTCLQIGLQPTGAGHN